MLSSSLYSPPYIVSLYSWHSFGHSLDKALASNLAMQAQIMLAAMPIMVFIQEWSEDFFHPDYIGRASYKIYELTESEPVRVGPCSLHFNRLSRSFLCELCFTSNAVSLMGSLGISVIFVFLCTDTPHVRAPGLIWIYHYSVPLVCLTAGYLYCWGLLENHILRVTTCPSQSQM